MVSRAHKNFLSHFYIVKTVVLPLRNSTNMPASRLPAPNGPDITRLAPLYLKNKNGSKKFYELLRPISTHKERPSNFKKLCSCYSTGFIVQTSNHSKLRMKKIKVSLIKKHYLVQHVLYLSHMEVAP